MLPLWLWLLPVHNNISYCSRYSWHISRSSGLAKTILQDSERGKKTGQTEEEVGRQHQARSSPSPRGQWRTGKNGGHWLRNYLWCPNDPRGLGIDEMREKERLTTLKSNRQAQPDSSSSSGSSSSSSNSWNYIVVVLSLNPNVDHAC